MMELIKSQDFFNLTIGSIITKRNFFDLIQFSKVEFSQYWSGSEFVIGNTPQQGINWIGVFPDIKAVIIKTRPGLYLNDGWVGDSKRVYQYSFKARGGIISYTEKANDVLIKQPQFNYPIFLFSELKNSWYYEGAFSVVEISDASVVLNMDESNFNTPKLSLDEIQYSEGDRRYVIHLLAERNKNVITLLKNCKNWVCEICDLNFINTYGVPYVEAHHKVPLSSYTSKHTVKLDDFALLCPNCHRAVHIYMKMKNQPYSEIKNILKSSLKL